MKKEWKESDVNKLKKWVDTKSNKELSEYFNVSDASIEHVLSRHGIKRKNNKYSRKDITYIEVTKVDYLPTPCYECTSHQISPNGYPMKKVKGKKSIMARYIYEEHFKKEIPKGYLIRHKCDNKLCINPYHLEIGTHMNNINDSIERDRIRKGSLINTAQLTENKVKEIKNKLKYYEYGMVKKLAKEYKVSIGIIKNIKNGSTWKHVKIDD